MKNIENRNTRNESNVKQTEIKEMTETQIQELGNRNKKQTTTQNKTNKTTKHTQTQNEKNRNRIQQKKKNTENANKQKTVILQITKTMKMKHGRKLPLFIDSFFFCFVCLFLLVLFSDAFAYCIWFYFIPVLSYFHRVLFCLRSVFLCFFFLQCFCCVWFRFCFVLFLVPFPVFFCFRSFCPPFSFLMCSRFNFVMVHFRFILVLFCLVFNTFKLFRFADSVCFLATFISGPCWLSSFSISARILVLRMLFVILYVFCLFSSLSFPVSLYLFVVFHFNCMFY